MDASFLLPREEYAKVAEKYGRGPITFEIQKSSQALFYFGANHSRDPNDPQYPALRNYWDRFLKITDGVNRIVLVEGGLRQLRKDEEAAITTGSEGALITLLAHGVNILVACPDIGDEELMNRSRDIPREQTLLYWFLSWVNNFQKHADPKPNFEKSAELWLENQRKRHVWENVDVSLHAVKDLYKRLIGKEFDKDESPSNYVNPNRTETRINQVARAQSNLRDANIASEIERYWNEGKSIFAVFGKGHLIIEEPALRKCLK